MKLLLCPSCLDVTVAYSGWEDGPCTSPACAAPRTAMIVCGVACHDHDDPRTRAAWHQPAVDFAAARRPAITDTIRRVLAGQEDPALLSGVTLLTGTGAAAHKLAKEICLERGKTVCLHWGDDLLAVYTPEMVRAEAARTQG